MIMLPLYCLSLLIIVFEGTEDPDTSNRTIDMAVGLELTLNLWTHTLTLTYQGECVAVINGVRGRRLYPFLLYHKAAYYPVKLTYKEGPIGM